MALIRTVFILFALLFSKLYADGDVEKHRVIALPAHAVHNGDYFAVGDSIEISGTVNGDVYLLAEQVVVDGIVNGDVLAAGGSIDISGKVSHNARLLAGQVLIGGQINHNVTVISANMQLLSSGLIGGNLVATSGNVDLAGTIQSNVTMLASNARNSSVIQNDLNAYVGQMRITSKAHIGGNIDYRSNEEIWIESGAAIGGTVTHHPSFVSELVHGTWIQGFLVGSKVIAFLMNFLYSFVIGVILIKIFPKNLESTLHALQNHPWKSVGTGVVLLIVLPLASLILLMTILGVPFALTLIAANIIGLYTAKVYSIFWASNWFLGHIGMRANRLPSLSIGLVLYYCLTAIPVFGKLLAFAAMLFGLGAAVNAQAKKIGTL
jgi:cytoskeletal protein CcmA (bactofilin family)